MSFFKPQFLLTVFSVLLVLSGSALAGDMSLTAAKQAGLVGETSEGLVAATLPSPSAEINALINSTNQGRMVIYKKTAAEENVPVTQVQKLAAQKLFDLAPRGEMLLVDGQWRRKK